MGRRNYKHKDLKLLWTNSGGKCAFPNCNNDIICEDSNDILGIMAHIVGLQPDGPRGDKNYTGDLNCYDNLILLCPYHHTLVDKMEDKYPTKKLIEMKNDHENWVKNRLAIGKPWTANISQFHYINIPRLSLLAALYQFEVNFSNIDSKENLHSLGFELNKIMLKYKNLIEEMDIKSTSISDINNFTEDFIGITLSFNKNFRTKNVPRLDDFNEGKYKRTGDVLSDAHVYCKTNNFKIILPIEPKWITTSTAFSEFKGGNTKFVGLSTIKQISIDDKTVIATPLVLGTPKSIFDDF